MSEAKQQQSGMRMRPMGGTGCIVSEICLGAMTFSTLEDKGSNSWKMPVASRNESFAMLDRFVDFGGNFIDTADAYGQGDSEKCIGQWMQSKNAGRDFREKLVIATKVCAEMGKGVNERGLSRKHIMKAVDDSLQALNTNYIDLYQIHFPDMITPFKEVLMTLHDLVRIGKVRYIGISNFSGAQLEEFQAMINQHNLEPFVTLQSQYSLLCRDIEWDSLKVAKKYNLGLLPWSPLTGGWLSGRYQRDSKPPTEGRVAWAENVGWTATNWTSMATDKTFDIIEACGEIGKAHNRTTAQVALRWLLQKQGVTSVIIGANKMSHLEDNLGAVEFALSNEEMTRLDDLSSARMVVPYPFGWHMRREKEAQTKFNKL